MAAFNDDHERLSDDEIKTELANLFHRGGPGWMCSASWRHKAGLSHRLSPCFARRRRRCTKNRCECTATSLSFAASRLGRLLLPSRLWKR
jgi:hypothetical protein